MMSSYIEAAAADARSAVAITFHRLRRHRPQTNMIKLRPTNPARFFKASSSAGSVGLTPLHGIRSLLASAVRSISSSSLGSPLSLGEGFGRSFVSFSSAAVEEEEGKRILLPNNRMPPCLMVPSGLLLAEGEKEVSFDRLTTAKMLEKEEEYNSTSTNNDYYDLLSVAGKKLVLNKKIKKTKNVPLPWQRDFLPTDDAICFGSSHGWLAFIHPRNASIYLYNPLITDHSFPYIPLPPVETLSCVISSLRRCKNSTTTSSITTEFTIPPQISPVSSEHLCRDLFEKIAFSSPPPNGHGYSNDNCTVMAILCNQLAFCRIGDFSWTALPPGPYRDVVYLSEHQIFYTYRDIALEAWDLRNPASPKCTLLTEDPYPPDIGVVRKVVKCSYPRTYIAESSGELLMVKRYGSETVRSNGSETVRSKTVAFDVHKFDFVRKEWVYVPELGDDQVLFVGPNHCQSLSTRDFPSGTFIPNSIYFTHESVEKADGFVSNDLGFFNLKNKTIYRHHLKEGEEAEVQPLSTWLLY